MHLSRWLVAEGLSPADLDGAVIERFFADRRRAGHSKLLSARAAEPVLAYLREAGIVAAAEPLRCGGPVEEVLAGY